MAYNQTAGALAALAARIEQLAAEQAFPGAAPLLAAAKPPPAGGLMISIALAFTLCALTALLALFETARCIHLLICTDAKGSSRPSGVLRWLKSWRWIYALLLLLASVLEALSLLLFLEYQRAAVGRRAPTMLSTVAFSLYCTAAAFVVIMIGSRVSTDTEPGDDEPCSLVVRGRRVLCTSTGVLICCLALGCGAWLLVRYGVVYVQMDSTLDVLLAHQGACDSADPACGSDAIGQRLAAELAALSKIDTFKGVMLLLLAVLVLWTGYELLALRRRSATATKALLSRSAAVAYEKSYRASSMSSRSRSRSRYSRNDDLQRRGSTATTSSWYSSVDSEAMHVPPSYARSQSSCSSDDEDDAASTPGAYRSATVVGSKLDEKAQFGAQLQRKFGDGSERSYFNHHVGSERGGSRSSAPALSSSRSRSHKDAASLYTASSAPTYTSQLTLDAAAVLAAESAEVDAQLASDTSGIRWSCALTLAGLALFGAILVLKACIGPEVDLGDRPGFELVCVVWQTAVVNAHLPVLAVLMSRGAGFVREADSTVKA